MELPNLVIQFLHDRPEDGQRFIRIMRESGSTTRIELVDSLDELAGRVETDRADLVVCCTEDSENGPAKTLERLDTFLKSVPVILCIEEALDCQVGPLLAAGAFDCLRKEDAVRLPFIVNRGLEFRRHQKEIEVIREGLQQAERTVFDQLQLREWLMESVGEGIISVDSSGRLFQCNRLSLELLGGHPGPRHPDEWPEFYDLFAVGSVHRISREEFPMSLALRGLVGDPLEVRVGSPLDEKARYLELAAQPVIDDEGCRRGAVMSIRDCTTTRLALEEHLRLTTALDRTEEVIFLTDVEGRIRFVNGAFTRIYQYERAEALGNLPSMLESGDHDSQSYDKIWETILSGETWREVVTNLKKDGSRITMDVSITPLKSEQGQVTGFVAVQRDTSRELELREQLLQAQKMESLGRLAGGIAHDFNNQLSVILGFGELAQMDLDPDHPASENVVEILEAARRASELTRQILAFSRKQVLQPEVLSLGPLALGLKKSLGRLIGEDIQLKLDVEPDVPQVTLDPSQMEQILMNLVVNARDAMPGGGRLWVRLKRRDTPPRRQPVRPGETPTPYACLEVEDTGSGMSPEIVSQVFDPFFTTKEVGKGTGLGLSTTYGIVEQSHGTIEVDSEPGRGTKFSVLFPCALTSGKTRMVTASGKTMSHGSESVIVVEDDLSLRKLVVRILSTHGYDVRAFTSGDELLEHLAELEPAASVLLTDVVMPGRSGIETAEDFTKRFPETRIIFMSGFIANERGQTNPLPASAHFLAKPFTPIQLIDRVRTVLDSDR